MTRPNCNNCKHAGKPFKAFGMTHVHCGHPVLTSEATSPWETLKEWWYKCKSHEAKVKDGD